MDIVKYQFYFDSLTYYGVWVAVFGTIFKNCCRFWVKTVIGQAIRLSVDIFSKAEIYNFTQLLYIMKFIYEKTIMKFIISHKQRMCYHF